MTPLNMTQFQDSPGHVVVDVMVVRVLLVVLVNVEVAVVVWQCKVKSFRGNIGIYLQRYSTHIGKPWKTMVL